ncbi:hypothetical protein [Psychroserpens sp.]|uniref:hypothetical protein n=1 Tax=Psychroserpens sp. TaxID=2020870 RepID=UPI001B009AC6|nr:hypothetical protein [Psychroserpens sp.]MBO6606596.1 hypothetical protein [Psychroserpens sp.]MBO6631943.1 hypothetical protein [Psychroserpens sp.]MBO6653300.1 hypothetical protein [Psychroserpens sp.]MBO6680673.1 hypothetical protein [Psychroserpens sp.]MBO6750369.1 hypothetical protein [Psychroserpens sp.]
MGLELIIFIVAVLFGIFLYWRESNGNGAYRFVNKIVNSKELQMSADNPKGFVYKQAFIPRLIFMVSLVLVAAVVVEFLTPISVFGSYNGISAFSSFAAGALLGTYLANFVLKSSKVIEAQSETIEEKFEQVVEKGKDLLDDLKSKDQNEVDTSETEVKTSEPKVQEKSARERLKDKGLM